MKWMLMRNTRLLAGFLAGALMVIGAGNSAHAQSDARPDAEEVLVYPLLSEGSIMHWLAVSPVPYNVAYIADSMSYDPFLAEGQSELTIRPRAGDRLRGFVWRKMHYAGGKNGPTMCELFQVAGRSFNFALTVNAVYIYSPQDRPNAIFSGSADDGLKVIFNGEKIWSNQIQRSPTYDSDQAPAPLKKGWNTLICVVDQAVGGHLLTARFLDGGEPILDLELALDPPAADAKRYPAEDYNRDATEAIRLADELRGQNQADQAIAAYDQVLTEFPLSNVAARAAYAKAGIYFNVDQPQSSQNKPQESAAALEQLLKQYGQDALAPYALLDLGRIQASALKDLDAAEATFARFEKEYPDADLAANAIVEQGRLLVERGRFEDAVLTYRRAIRSYPESDQVMIATVAIGDAYAAEGEAEKSVQQYIAARDLAQDWYENKYGVDVGKQAWLREILEYLRLRIDG